MCGRRGEGRASIMAVVKPEQVLKSPLYTVGQPRQAL